MNCLIIGYNFYGCITIPGTTLGELRKGSHCDHTYFSMLQVYKYLPRLSPSVGNILDEITRHQRISFLIVFIGKSLGKLSPSRYVLTLYCCSYLFYFHCQNSKLVDNLFTLCCSRRIRYKTQSLSNRDAYFCISSYCLSICFFGKK